MTCVYPNAENCTAPPSTSPTTTVVVQPIPHPGGPQLPFTGSDSYGLIGISVVLLLLGLALANRARVLRG